MDGSGAILNSYNYKAYGDTRSKIEGIANSYLYTGRRLDSHTGDYYYRARYYQPGIGRFNGVDRKVPKEASYRYVGGNPVMYRDPLGLGPDAEWAQLGQSWYSPFSDFIAFGNFSQETETSGCCIDSLLEFDDCNKEEICGEFIQTVRENLAYFVKRRDYEVPAYVDYKNGRVEKEVEEFYDGGYAYGTAAFGVAWVSIDCEGCNPFAAGATETRVRFCGLLAHENEHVRHLNELHQNLQFFTSLYETFGYYLFDDTYKTIERPAYNRSVKFLEGLLQDAITKCESGGK